jgi:hypothetical protein
MSKYACVGRPNLKLSGVTNSGSKNPVFGYKIAGACVTQYVAANPAVARTASRRSDVFRHAKKIVNWNLFAESSPQCKGMNAPVVQQQVIIAKVRPDQVPVEVLGLANATT